MPKLVDTSSKFYITEQRCLYHSNSVGHDTKDYINLKHNIQNLIAQEVVSLHAAAPNVNTNPLPNHVGININMIKMDDNWCVSKVITLLFHDELERLVASLSLKEKKEFMILTPAKVVALVAYEAPVRPKFVIEIASEQGMTQFGRYYNLEGLDSVGQKKDQGKRLISEG